MRMGQFCGNDSRAKRLGYRRIDLIYRSIPRRCVYNSAMTRAASCLARQTVHNVDGVRSATVTFRSGLRPRRCLPAT